MAERFSHEGFDKVVGVTGDLASDPEGLKRNIDWRLKVRGAAPFEGVEVDKTAEEQAIIDLATQYVDETLANLGRAKQFDVPAENIHLLREGGTGDALNKRLSEGAYGTIDNSILVDRSPSRVDFALSIVHELFHSKCYKALQVGLANGRGWITTYRSGTAVNARDRSAVYLEDVEEAIVGYLTKRFYEDVVLRHPFFSTEVQERLQAKVVTDTSRMKELAQLDALVDDLFAKNVDEFKDRNEVFNIFLDAQVNGNLMRLGRLIEHTYGKGSFRTVAEDGMPQADTLDG